MSQFHFVVLGLLCTYAAAFKLEAAEVFASSEKWTLPLDKAVIILNENSPFQINLECDSIIPTVSLAKNLGIYRASNAVDIMKILSSSTNYSVVRINSIFTVLPEFQRQTKSDPLNLTVPHFDVRETNLFLALHQLCMAMPPPFEVEFTHPMLITRSLPPRLDLDYSYWPSEEFPRVTFTAVNQRTWQILNMAINQHLKAYWIARPLHRTARKSSKYPDQIRAIEVHHPRESRTEVILFHAKKSEYK